jgi:hypothetical protein
MGRVDHISLIAASRHIARVASLLNLAGRYLSAASRIASDQYHREQLHRLAQDIRNIIVLLSRYAIALEKGCDR